MLKYIYVLYSIYMFICKLHINFKVSLLAQMVKNLPAMQETWVQSLGQEDPLEKGMATHSSILAWRILWTEEPGVLQSMGSQRVKTLLKRLSSSSSSRESYALFKRIYVISYVQIYVQYLVIELS